MDACIQRCVLGDAETLEIAFAPGGWRLAYRRDGETLLVYTGDAAGVRRVRGGRSTAHALRSVEQLRYDFEREVAELRTEAG